MWKRSKMAAVRSRCLLKTAWKKLSLSRCSQTLAADLTHDDSVKSEPSQDRTEIVPKAFIVLPNYQTRELEKNLWMTKTVLRKELPKQFKDPLKLIPDDDLGTLKSLFKDCIRQKYGFQKEVAKRRSEVEEEVSLGVVLELLRFCFSHLYTRKTEMPHLRESFLDINPQVITHWKRKGQFYQLKTRPACILWTRYPMEVFDEELEAIKDHKLPGPYKPLDLDVYTHSFVPLKNVPGCHNRQQNLFPYSHTMFLSGLNQSLSQMQSTGVMNMFSLLVSHALDDGNPLGADLERPLTTRCIATDGTKFTFMCYQLNTLDLGRNKSDSGVKNVAWTTSCMDLFRKKPHNNRKKRALIYESIGARPDLPHFNEECFRNFIHFISLP